MQDTKESFNNHLRVTGIATCKPTYTHTVNTSKENIRYCTFEIKSRRLSGDYDLMNVSAKEHLITTIDFSKPIAITGEIRTTNIGAHLKIYVFVTEISNCDQKDEDINLFEGTVYICKKPNYRKTPAGKHITDLTLACIRSYKNRSDYFPTITWGKQAKTASGLVVGEKLYIKGRFQSRFYDKIVDGINVKKIAYELSLKEFELLDQRR